MADLHAGRPAVGQDAAGLALQDRQQRAGQCRIARVQVQRGGQLAFERLGQRLQFLGIAATHDQAGGAEDLVVQRRLGLEARGIGAEEAGLGAVGRIAALPARHAAHVGLAGQAFDAAGVRGVDAGSQHGLRAAGLQGLGGGGLEGIEVRPVDGQQQARVGAELPRAHRERADVLLAQHRRALGQRVGQQEDRVDGAQLAIHGNRLRTRLGDAQQRLPARARAGEADRLDARIGHQRPRDLVVGQDQREHAFRQPALRHGRLDGAADQLGGARMRRMRLHHHRAARRQRRRRIAARHREGQREIAGAEHRHRPHRNAAHAQVRTRQRLTLRQRRVDARTDGIARAHHFGKQAQLVAGAAALAFQARPRQRGFGHGALDQRIAQCLDLAGDGLQERGTRFGRGLAVNVERRASEFASAGNVGLAGQGELGFEPFARGRVHGADRAGATRHAGGTQQQFAAQIHAATSDATWVMVRPPAFRPRQCGPPGRPVRPLPPRSGRSAGRAPGRRCGRSPSCRP